MDLTDKQTQRKERILQAASDWFFAEGFYKVSLHDLVARLRISKSTIYEFFGSKEGLVEAAIDRLGAQLEARLDELVGARDKSVQQRILEIAEFQGEVAKNVGNKFFTELKIHSPLLWDKYQERRNVRVEKYYAKLIDEGREQGIFDPALDKDFVLQLYLKMSEMVSYTDIMEHVPMTKPQTYKALIKVFLRGAGVSGANRKEDE